MSDPATSDFVRKKGGPLQALRNAGSISGLCLAEGRQPLENLFPISEDQLSALVGIVDDILAYFEREGRSVDQMAFGYDGSKIVIVSDTRYRLIVRHERAEEIDFIAKAGHAFLIDHQLHLHASKLQSKPEQQAPLSPAQPPKDEDAEVQTGPVQPILPTPKGEHSLDDIPEETVDEVDSKEGQEDPQLIVARAEDMSDRHSVFTGKNRPEEDLSANTHRGTLAPDQPENTLPPPRRPKHRH